MQMTSGRHQGRTELDSRNCAALIRQILAGGRGARNRRANRARFHTAWVKSCKAQNEQMFSGLSLKADLRAGKEHALVGVRPV